MGHASAEWRLIHDDLVAKAVAKAGGRREDYVDSTEFAALLGRHGLKRPDSLMRYVEGAVGSLPAPAFVVRRTRYWRREDAEKLAAAWADRQRSPSRNGDAQPLGALGYRGVRFHSHSGLYQAVVNYDGRVRSVGYWRTAVEAARAVDWVRLSLGRPAANFLGDEAVTLAMPDPRAKAKQRGPRGVARLVADFIATADRPVTNREVFDHVQKRGADTTLGTVENIVWRLRRAGKITPSATRARS